MEQPIWFTALLNWLLGKPVAALLAALHIHPGNADMPIPNHVAMEILVFLVAIVLFLSLKRRLSVERPGALQQCMEMLLTNPLELGIRDMLESNIEHGAGKYLAMLGSIGIFVLMCNLISLVPGLESPTGQVSVPFGCAILVFIYYNYSGIVKHGPFHYSMEFVKMPIELVSHAARLLSLTVRLWVNIMVSELLYGIFLGLLLDLFLYLGKLNTIGYVSFILPLAVPVAFMALHIFVGILQAFVFTILPVIYVAGAVKEEY